MFKKIIAIFMVILICFIQIGCCYTGKIYNKKDINTAYLNHKLKNIKKSPLHNQNFIFLKKFIMTKNHKDFNELCYEDTIDKHKCVDPLVPLNSASGYIIKVDKKNNKLYALTAAHWCEDITKKELYEITNLLLDKKPVIGSFANFMGNEYRISNTRKFDDISDICLIEFTSKYSKYARNIKIANDIPVIGSNVYSISAPQWSHENEIRQHYTGKFSGCNSHSCMFTLPATYGSSGSAVINEDGEIISIISMASIDFNNFTIGPSLSSLKIFLEYNL